MTEIVPRERRASPPDGQAVYYARFRSNKETKIEDYFAPEGTDQKDIVNRVRQDHPDALAIDVTTGLRWFPINHIGPQKYDTQEDLEARWNKLMEWYRETSKANRERFRKYLSGKKPWTHVLPVPIRTVVMVSWFHLPLVVWTAVAGYLGFVAAFVSSPVFIIAQLLCYGALTARISIGLKAAVGSELREKLGRKELPS